MCYTVPEKRCVAAVSLTLALGWMCLAEAAAESRVYTFAYDQPPAELTITAMAVQEGEAELRLTFAGDCTLGGEGTGERRFATVLADEGLVYPFLRLSALFQADDLTMVNLEGPLTGRKIPAGRKEFHFRGEPEYAGILTLGGVEAVGLANNHTLDYSDIGLRDTKAALAQQAIGWCGGDDVLVLDRDGLCIGVTASGFSLDRGLWRKQVQALRALGCTVIVHWMHMGEEYARALTAGQRETARYLAENGATLVVGSHPHVAQGLEQIGDALVAYSLGNCVFGGNTDPPDYTACVLSVTLRFTDGVPESLQATLWPIRVSGSETRNDFQPVLLQGEAAQQVLEHMQATSGFALAPFRDGSGAMLPEIRLQ